MKWKKNKMNDQKKRTNDDCNRLFESPISKFNCVYASIPIEGMCVQYRERMGKNNYTRNQNLIWWNWMKFAFALIENNIMSWVELIWFDLSHAQAPFLRHIYYFTYYSIELASIICEFFLFSRNFYRHIDIGWDLTLDPWTESIWPSQLYNVNYPHFNLIFFWKDRFGCKSSTNL